MALFVVPRDAKREENQYLVIRIGVTAKLIIWRVPLKSWSPEAFTRKSITMVIDSVENII